MRAFYFLAIVVSVACGTHNPTNFNDPASDDSVGGSGAGVQGGSAGTVQGGAAGSGGTPLGGAGGSAQAGSGAGGAPSGGAGGTPSGGSAGSPSGGAAGAGLGGAISGSGGTPSTSGSSSGGSNGARGGSGGSQTVSFSCGSLMCVADRQYCVRTLPEISGEPEMRMCLPFPDSCTTLNCDCFCKGPMMQPCGTGSVCTCSDNNGQISVLCARS